jgi:hypothetical protein
MLLQYPATGVVISEVALRNPELGNLDRTDANIVNRESRHGTPFGYKDPTWPVFRTKFFSIQALTKTVIDSLKEFLVLTAGLQIKLTDHEGTVFSGFIVTGSNEIVTTKDNCSYDVTFEFL